MPPARKFDASPKSAYGGRTFAFAYRSLLANLEWLMTRTTLLGLVATLNLICSSTAYAAPYAIAVGWDGGNSPVSRVDLGSGVETPLASSGFGTLNALALSPSGDLLAAGNTPSLVRINPVTGQGMHAAVLGNLTPGISLRGLAFSSTGVLYAINNGDPVGGGSPDRLYTIDQSTGAATFIGQVGYVGVQGIDFAPDGTLYGWDVGWDVSGVGLITIDAVTGAAADVNPAIGDFRAIQAIAFGPGGRLYGATNGPQSAIVEINRFTGETTIVVPTTNVDIRGLAIVPEPMAILLGLIGLAGCVHVGWRTVA
jgi:hypothetical protein